MTLAMINIIDVWRVLGGAELSGKRGRAFWRGGGDYNVSLNVNKGVWFDHRDGKGGGVLKLVMVARDSSNADALTWLERNGFIEPRHLSPAERSRYRQVAARADALADRLADFAHGLKVLIDRKLRVLGALIEFGIEPPESMLGAHLQAWALRCASERDLAELWNNSPRERDTVERIGSADRRHAEKITAAIVELLAESQEKMEAA